MIITTTERAEFKRCRRRWDYGSFNRQSLARIVPKKALSLGRLVHKSLADWVKEPDLDLVEIFMRHSVQEIDEAKEAYRKQVGCSISEAELEPLYDAVGLGRAMMANYQTYWGAPLGDRFEIVSPEQMVVIPITGTDHSIEMKFDGIIRNDQDMYFVLEHKTYSTRPRLESLLSNDQFLAYAWGLGRLGIGRVGGLAYDGMWKRASPPKGGQLADLFMRTLIQRPPDEYAEFEDFLKQEAEDMYITGVQADAQRQAGLKPTVLYLNRRWEGCYDCDFEPLCTAESRGEDVDYLKASMYTLRTREEVVEEA